MFETPLIMLRRSLSRAFCSLLNVSCRLRSLPGSETGESAEEPLETFDHSLLDLGQRHLCASQLAREARNPILLDAAGCEPVEPREVGGHVEGEAVGGDAPGGELHSDGGDLVLSHPHPRVCRMPPGMQPKVREDEDKKLLQVPQVLVGVELFEAQYRVSDQLPGTVKRRVPTPVAPKHLCPQRLQVLLPRPQVRSVPGRAADGVDRRVLQEDERVRDLVPLAEPDELSLQLPPLHVRRQTWETTNLEGCSLGGALLKLHGRSLPYATRRRSCERLR